MYTVQSCITVHRPGLSSRITGLFLDLSAFLFSVFLSYLFCANLTLSFYKMCAKANSEAETQCIRAATSAGYNPGHVDENTRSYTHYRVVGV